MLFRSLIWKVSYNDSVPVLENTLRLETSFAQSCWNVVFDVAGNVYASGAGSLCAWALPTQSNACVVNAPDDDMITVVLTSVENIYVDTTIFKEGFYTITGQYLGTDENNLPQGLYIINGKKVIK